MLREAGLINLRPVVLRPTCRNGRTSDRGISKRLDRFLMVDQLTLAFHRYRVWHVNSMISDHLPICLQLDLGGERIVYPFKYNHHWMDYLDFQPLVRTFWAMDHGISHWSPMDRLVEKLRLLKGTVKRWSREKNIQGEEELCSLELALNEVFTDNPSGNYSEKEKNCLTELEDRKHILLRLEEE